MGWISSIIIGAFAGWIASIVMHKNEEMGAFANIVVGIIGGALGRLILGLIDVKAGEGWLASAGVGIFGAIILLAIINLIKGRR